MLLQEIDWFRLFAVVVQLISCFIFLFISYKILSRNRNRLAITGSSFYIIITTSFILNIIYFPLTVNPLVYVLHLISVYLIFLSLVFLVIFNLTLLKSENIVTRTKQLIHIILYGILLFIILLFPGGITIDESTNWRPEWSWSLFIILYIFLTITIIIPFFYLSKKLYNTIQDDFLKKRWKLYILGFCGLIFILYGFILYNTWNEPIFRAIWSIVVLLLIPSAILIYYGIGRQLE